MRDDYLPNYQNYLEKLLLFAQSKKIKVIYPSRMGDIGYYDPEKRSIGLDPLLSKQEEIAVFLHELGHAIDDSLRFGSELEKKLDKVYRRYYANKRINKKEMKLIRNCEHRAWRYAKSIAKMLNISLGKWFYVVKKECLEGYVE